MKRGKGGELAGKGGTRQAGAFEVSSILRQSGLTEVVIKLQRR